jgi:hypothetical protein
VEPGSQFGVSPLGVHVAMQSHSGSRIVMVYDGVAGPKFDQIFAQGATTGALGVTFSPDGKRYAYCGRVGSEFVVMVDGKETARGSEGNPGLSDSSCAISFTPGSKHVYYTSLARTGYRIVFDGKASPPGASGDPRDFVVSPNDDHYAYPWADPTPGSRIQKLVVDGNPAPYYGTGPQWSPDSQHLYTKASVPGGGAIDVLEDGKPVMRTNGVTLYLPPVGNMGIAVINRGTPPGMFIAIGGKVVPGSEAGPARINEVVFSPDGKHYAVRYNSQNGQAFVFADGKKGLEYQTIVSNLPTPGVQSKFAGFTADSKVVYIGNSPSGQFLVIGDEETQLAPGGNQILIGPTGNRVAAAGPATVILDGKAMKFPGGQENSLKFSPDGSHFAFALNAQGALILVLDGVPQSGHGMIEAPYAFSPNSKHIAYVCRPPNPTGNDDVGVCLDDKYVRTGALVENLTFTPDSNHIFWVRRLGVTFRLFADGKPVLDGTSTATAGFRKETMQIDPSGALLILSQDATSLKRFSITPSPDSSIASLFGGAPGLPAKP